MNPFNKLLMFPSKHLLAIGFFFLATLFFMTQLFHLLRVNTSEEKSLSLLSSKDNRPLITRQSRLFSIALFGDYQPLDEDIKQSSLDLDVVGIMYSPDKIQSQVLIRVGAAEEKLYKIGDSLPGGAIIKKINKQDIVVLYQGELESLSLPKNELLFDKPAKLLMRE